MTELPPLAEFLRSRRDRLTPADVGLTSTGRRRTPGLRREEVATLAGVSIDYLVRLEQGRDTNPSPEILSALASALRLGPDETRHLYGVALRGASPHLDQFCPASPVLDTVVSSTIERLLEQLGPVPAFVVGPLSDVLAANDAWVTLMAPWGLAPRHNLARFLFLDPASRRAFPDWDVAADEQVAALRSVHPELEAEQAFVALLDDLVSVPAFAERWAAHPVAEGRSDRLRVDAADLGEIHFVVEPMDLAGQDQQLVAWLPADAASEALLGRAVGTALAVSPAHLRVVGDD